MKNWKIALSLHTLLFSYNTHILSVSTLYFQNMFADLKSNIIYANHSLSKVCRNKLQIVLKHCRVLSYFYLYFYIF